MPDLTVPRCSNCWSPLRRDGGRWVNDEPVSSAKCQGLPRPHEPMDADEHAAWAASNSR